MGLPQKYFNTKFMSGLKLPHMYCCIIKQPLSCATETAKCSQTSASTKQPDPCCMLSFAIGD